MKFLKKILYDPYKYNNIFCVSYLLCYFNIQYKYEQYISKLVECYKKPTKITNFLTINNFFYLKLVNFISLK